jgi:hypothetical protein
MTFLSNAGRMHCPSFSIIRLRSKTRIVTVMVDTIHLLLTSRETGQEFCLNSLGKRLQDAGALKAINEGFVVGYLGNLKVMANRCTLTIKGSLPKFILGNNVEALTRSEIIDATGQLSDLLLQPIEAGKLTRLDIGTGFIVKQPPVSYFAMMQGCPRYHRHSDGTTLYYLQKQNSLAFYDKPKEAGKNLPAIYKGRNVLRYEYRLLKNPSQQVKTHLTLATLTQEETYIMAVDLWAEKYFSIKKNNGIIGIDIMKINTPADMKHLLAALAAQTLGHERIHQLIEEVKASKGFKYAKEKARFKEQAEELLNFPCIDAGFELSEELDKKVRQQQFHYR